MAKLVPIVCEGISFSSVAAMCAHYGVERFKTHSRIQRGWTPEQAVGLVVHQESIYRPKTVAINGIHYATMTDAALALGVKLATVKARIKHGYSVEDAFLGNLKLRTSTGGKEIDFRGEHFASNHELAQRHGISGGLMAREPLHNPFFRFFTPIKSTSCKREFVEKWGYAEVP